MPSQGSRRKSTPGETGTTRNAPRDDAGPSGRRARIAGLVRLARRAGRVIVGVRMTREAVRERRAAVVLMADDLSSKRADTLVARWEAAGVPIVRGWTKDELGELMGRAAVSVLAVTDANMAHGIAAILDVDEGRGGVDREREE